MKVPIILIAAALILVPALLVLSVPLSLLMRYRAGIARRPAKGWIAATNVFFMGLSVAGFLVTAAISNNWLPGAFRYSSIGLLAGVAPGILGVILTRWEPTAGALHYTPNRWLIIA